MVQVCEVKGELPLPFADHFRDLHLVLAEVERGIIKPNYFATCLTCSTVYGYSKDMWAWAPHVLLVLNCTISLNPLKTVLTESFQPSLNPRIGEMSSNRTVPAV